MKRCNPIEIVKGDVIVYETELDYPDSAVNVSVILYYNLNGTKDSIAGAQKEDSKIWRFTVDTTNFPIAAGKYDIVVEYSIESNDCIHTLVYSNTFTILPDGQRSSQPVLSDIEREPYLLRKSAGSLATQNFYQEKDKIVGGTLAWNQMVPSTTASKTQFGVTLTNNGDGSYTLNGTATSTGRLVLIGRDTGGSPVIGPVNHKYFLVSRNSKVSTSWGYLCFVYTGSGISGESSGENGKIINYTYSNGFSSISFRVFNGVSYDNEIIWPQCFDLTLMFGPTIADYVYSLEQANAGAGIAWFRNFFPKLYYAHNAGGLMNVCTNAHITRGFNQWDEEWEVGRIDGNTGEPKSYGGTIRSKNFNRCMGSTDYYFYRVGSSTSRRLIVYWYDSNKKYISEVYANHLTITSPQNAYYFKISTFASNLYQYTPPYNHDICVNLSDPTRNGQYEPHHSNVYPLSPVELRGIPRLDANDKLYFDGDIYEYTRKVTRRYGLIDLGTLEWIRVTQYAYPVFYAKINGIKYVGTTDKVTTLCEKYVSLPNMHYSDFRENDLDKKCCVLTDHIDAPIAVQDSSYTSASDFKTAMSGVYLVCELETPVAEHASRFTERQTVYPGGTEEYIDALATDPDVLRDVSIPVGHETQYLLK